MGDYDGAGDARASPGSPVGAWGTLVAARSGEFSRVCPSRCARWQTRPSKWSGLPFGSTRGRESLRFVSPLAAFTRRLQVAALCCSALV